MSDALSAERWTGLAALNPSAILGFNVLLAIGGLLAAAWSLHSDHRGQPEPFEVCAQRVQARYNGPDEQLTFGMVRACPDRPWPTICHLAWLTCTEDQGCPLETYWLCAQALCASVSEIVDCGVIEPNEWNDDAYALAGGRAMGVEVSNASLAELRDLMRQALDSRAAVSLTDAQRRWWLSIVIVMRMSVGAKSAIRNARYD